MVDTAELTRPLVPGARDTLAPAPTVDSRDIFLIFPRKYYAAATTTIPGNQNEIMTRDDHRTGVFPSFLADQRVSRTDGACYNRRTDDGDGAGEGEGKGGRQGGRSYFVWMRYEIL